MASPDLELCKCCTGGCGYVRLVLFCVWDGFDTSVLFELQGVGADIT